MDKRTSNIICGGSILGMLLIAQLPLLFNVGVVAITGIALAYINNKNK